MNLPDWIDPSQRMRALTVHEPWAGWLASGVKPVENRSWPPPDAALGQPLAIHSSKRVERRGLEFGEDHGIKLHELVSGAVIGVGRLAAWFHIDGSARAREEGDISRPEVDDLLKSVFFVGPFGWVLKDVIRLESPVPASGRQRLWYLDSATKFLVLGQIAANRKVRT